MDKLIITAAICGAEVTKADNPNLPVTAAELAAAALEAERAGASIIHLHVRDEEGRPTQKKAYFEKAIRAMKEQGLTAVIQPSTGGAVGMSAAERIEVLDLKPEMATLDCGTMNFGDEIFVNALPLMRQIAERMRAGGIIPELECFEPGHISNAVRLQKEGLLPERLHLNLVLGVPGTIPASLRNLMFMVEQLPPGATWTSSGIGSWQLPIAMHSMLSGGHVRVGFEDNIYYSKGVKAASNAQLVERIVRIANEAGRDIASPDEARRILGIKEALKRGIK